MTTAAAGTENVADVLLLRILKELPLREVLPLRAVNTKWKAIIETKICKEKKSLKLFGSVKAMLDYYQMAITREYSLQVCCCAFVSYCVYPLTLTPFQTKKGIPVEVNRHIVVKKKKPLQGNQQVLNIKNLCAFKDLPAMSDLKFSRGCKLPEDDYLFFTPYSTKAVNLLLQLFPAVERLVIYHIGCFSERYFRLPFRMPSLKSLEMYEKNATFGESSGPRFWANGLSNERATQFSFRPAHEDISASYRYLYTRALDHLEELTLDGVFLGKYCLWELLLEVGAGEKIALKRLKLSRFAPKQLTSGRALKAVASAQICQQLTHLTVDSLNCDLLDFFIQKFPHLEYLDIGVEHGVSGGLLVPSFIHSEVCFQSL